MVTRQTSDEACSQLRRAGWSIGDVAFVQYGEPIWLVYGHRGEQHIIARGLTQLEAWLDAAKLASQIEQGARASASS